MLTIVSACIRDAGGIGWSWIATAQNYTLRAWGDVVAGYELVLVHPIIDVDIVMSGDLADFVPLESIR